jgi:hypothetical protein
MDKKESSKNSLKLFIGNFKKESQQNKTITMKYSRNESFKSRPRVSTSSKHFIMEKPFISAIKFNCWEVINVIKLF